MGKSIGRRVTGLLVLCALNTGLGWGASAPASGVLTYVRIQTPAGQEPQQEQIRIWFKGARFREEITTPGGQEILIGGPDERFFLRAGSRIAYRDPTPARLTQQGSLWDLEYTDIALITTRMRKVGSEKLDERLTDIYQTKAGSGSVRIWISSDLPLPVKLVVRRESVLASQPASRPAAVSDEVTIRLTAAQLALPVPDHMFQLPAGTTVQQDLPARGRF